MSVGIRRIVPTQDGFMDIIGVKSRLTQGMQRRSLTEGIITYGHLHKPRRRIVESIRWELLQMVGTQPPSINQEPRLAFFWWWGGSFNECRKKKSGPQSGLSVAHRHQGRGSTYNLLILTYHTIFGIPTLYLESYIVGRVHNNKQRVIPNMGLSLLQGISQPHYNEDMVLYLINYHM